MSQNVILRIETSSSDLGYAGILGAVIFALLLIIGGAAIGGLLGLAGLGGLFGGLLGGGAVLLSLGQAILCLIGGLVGGALRRR